jgi:hypothetical protein
VPRLDRRSDQRGAADGRRDPFVELRAVDKRKIDRLIGIVTDAELALIEASVKAVFGLK